MLALPLALLSTTIKGSNQGVRVVGFSIKGSGLLVLKPHEWSVAIGFIKTQKNRDNLGFFNAC